MKVRDDITVFSEGGMMSDASLFFLSQKVCLHDVLHCRPSYLYCYLLQCPKHGPAEWKRLYVENKNYLDTERGRVYNRRVTFNQIKINK